MHLFTWSYVKKKQYLKLFLIGPDTIVLTWFWSIMAFKGVEATGLCAHSF